MHEQICKKDLDMYMERCMEMWMERFSHGRNYLNNLSVCVVCVRACACVCGALCVYVWGREREDTWMGSAHVLLKNASPCRGSKPPRPVTKLQSILCLVNEYLS